MYMDIGWPWETSLAGYIPDYHMIGASQQFCNTSHMTSYISFAWELPTKCIGQHSHTFPSVIHDPSMYIYT